MRREPGEEQWLEQTLAFAAARGLGRPRANKMRREPGEEQWLEQTLAFAARR